MQIRTASRLHFGLLSLPGATASDWDNEEGQPTMPRRRFGGVGLMIEQPGITLHAEPAEVWHADGPLAERALTFAKTVSRAIDRQQPFQLSIESAAPEHAGLGTGTQLGLAVARAVAGAMDATRLAQLVGRGLRSSLGIHGFDRGGLLVEGGKTNDAMLSPLICRQPFPDDWRILLVMLPDLVGTHGRREIDAFADIAQHAPADAVTETLCRTVLLGMLPALAERDLRTFSEALYDFNRRAGTAFRASQGGVYAHPRIEALIQTIRGTGTAGVGQSSWGPTVFAVVAEPQARDLRDWLIRRRAADERSVIIARACNQGAHVSG